jgi:hypothetical protein
LSFVAASVQLRCSFVAGFLLPSFVHVFVDEQTPASPCMQDEGEEDPIAIAFRDSRRPGQLVGGQILEELVFEDDIFWGTIYRNFDPQGRSTVFLTRRNNRRIDWLIYCCFPLQPYSLRLAIAELVHLHY